MYGSVLALETPDVLDKIAQIVFDKNHGRTAGEHSLCSRAPKVLLSYFSIESCLGISDYMQAGVFDRRDRLLRVAVNVHVKQQQTKQCL